MKTPTPETRAGVTLLNPHNFDIKLRNIFSVRLTQKVLFFLTFSSLCFLYSLV